MSDGESKAAVTMVRGAPATRYEGQAPATSRYAMGGIFVPHGPVVLHGVAHELGERLQGVATGQAELFGLRDRADVVLKVYFAGRNPKGRATKEMLERYQAIRSPHLMRLLDFGFGADGLEGQYDWELLELLEPLRSPLEDGPRDAWLEQRLAPALGSAAEALLSAALVHCDIKPANLMQRPSTGEIVLVDIGSVKGVNADTRESVTTLVATTSAYAAPELLRKHVNEKTDAFSIGMTLFEFAQPGSLSSPRDKEVIARISRGQPVLDRLGSAPRLCDLVNGLTRGDLTARWGCEEFRQWVSGKQVVAPTPELSLPTIKWRKQQISTVPALLQVMADEAAFWSMCEDEGDLPYTLRQWVHVLHDDTVGAALSRLVKRCLADGEPALGVTAIRRVLVPDGPFSVKGRQFGGTPAGAVDAIRAAGAVPADVEVALRLWAHAEKTSPGARVLFRLVLARDAEGSRVELHTGRLASLTGWEGAKLLRQVREAVGPIPAAKIEAAAHRVLSLVPIGSEAGAWRHDLALPALLVADEAEHPETWDVWHAARSAVGGAVVQGAFVLDAAVRNLSPVTLREIWDWEPGEYWLDEVCPEVAQIDYAEEAVQAILWAGAKLRRRVQEEFGPIPRAEIESAARTVLSLVPIGTATGAWQHDLALPALLVPDEADHPETWDVWDAARSAVGGAVVGGKLVLDAAVRDLSPVTLRELWEWEPGEYWLNEVCPEVDGIDDTEEAVQAILWASGRRWLVGDTFEIHVPKELEDVANSSRVTRWLAKDATHAERLVAWATESGLLGREQRKAVGAEWLLTGNQLLWAAGGRSVSLLGWVLRNPAELAEISPPDRARLLDDSVVLAWLSRLGAPWETVPGLRPEVRGQVLRWFAGLHTLESSLPGRDFSIDGISRDPHREVPRLMRENLELVFAWLLRVTGSVGWESSKLPSTGESKVLCNDIVARLREIDPAYTVFVRHPDKGGMEYRVLEWDQIGTASLVHVAAAECQGCRPPECRCVVTSRCNCVWLRALATEMRVGLIIQQKLHGFVKLRDIQVIHNKSKDGLVEHLLLGNLTEIVSFARQAASERAIPQVASERAIPVKRYVDIQPEPSSSLEAYRSRIQGVTIRWVHYARGTADGLSWMLQAFILVQVFSTSIGICNELILSDKANNPPFLAALVFAFAKFIYLAITAFWFGGGISLMFSIIAFVFSVFSKWSFIDLICVSTQLELSLLFIACLVPWHEADDHWLTTSGVVNSVLRLSLAGVALASIKSDFSERGVKLFGIIDSLGINADSVAWSSGLAVVACLYVVSIPLFEAWLRQRRATVAYRRAMLAKSLRADIDALATKIRVRVRFY